MESAPEEIQKKLDNSPPSTPRMEKEGEPNLSERELEEPCKDQQGDDGERSKERKKRHYKHGERKRRHRSGSSEHHRHRRDDGRPDRDRRHERDVRDGRDGRDGRGGRDGREGRDDRDLRENREERPGREGRDLRDSLRFSGRDNRDGRDGGRDRDLRDEIRSRDPRVRDRDTRERERDRERDRDREHERERERDRNGRGGERPKDENGSRKEENRDNGQGENITGKKRKPEDEIPETEPVIQPTEDELEKRRLERLERWKRIKTTKEDVPNEPQISSPDQETELGQQHLSPPQVTQELPVPEAAAKPSEDVPDELTFDGMALEKTAAEKMEEESDEESGPDLFGDEDSEVDMKESSAIKAFTRVEVEPSDDNEGYYSFRLGEILGGKYVVVGYHGQGVFSNVLKCQEVGTDKEVAIKLLRNNEHMKRTGKKEVRILRQLRDSDPEGKSNNIRLLNDFEDRDHLCLVFEPMDCNLRQLLKKYGGRGISIVAVRFYASKLLRALIHLYNSGIIHADFKPDNILVNKERTLVKLADLGSGLELSEVEPTPYLVSRFYRAPEIILGLDYNQAIDVFSFGTCLYELATGKPLLKSRDNNHHLKLIQELKGPIPRRIVQRAMFKDRYFDESMNYFLETMPDPLDTGKAIVRKIRIERSTRDITKELLASYGSSDVKEKKMITLLSDLIERCVDVDPARRLTPQQAMRHELFKEV